MSYVLILLFLNQRTFWKYKMQLAWVVLRKEMI